MAQEPGCASPSRHPIRCLQLRHGGGRQRDDLEAGVATLLGRTGRTGEDQADGQSGQGAGPVHSQPVSCTVKPRYMSIQNFRKKFRNKFWLKTVSVGRFKKFGLLVRPSFLSQLIPLILRGPYLQKTILKIRNHF